MEKLAIMIQEMMQSNLWQPVQILDEGPSVPPLFFADDCLLVNQALVIFGRPRMSSCYKMIRETKNLLSK